MAPYAAALNAHLNVPMFTVYTSSRGLRRGSRPATSVIPRLTRTTYGANADQGSER